MGKFRFQYTLRTVFIVSFLFAIVCSLVKCEMVARNNFESIVGVVNKSLPKMNPEFVNVDAELYCEWCEEAKINPTFPAFAKKFPSEESRFNVVVGSGGSNCGQDFDYTGSTQFWTIRRSILSPRTDFSRTPWGIGDDIEVINLTIKCYRPCSIISRQTSISITAYPAQKNQLLLNRLKTELELAGLLYNIVEK
jgi:hypothetical protein